MKKSGNIWFHLLPSLLVPVFFFLHNWLDFGGMISLHQLAASLVWWLLAPPVCFAVVLLLTRSIPKAGFAALLISLVYFFVPSLQQGITHYTGLKAIAVLVVLLLAAVLVLAMQLKRKAPSYHRLLRFSTICLFVLLAVEGIRFASGVHPATPLVPIHNSQLPGPAAAPKHLQPDIYYFIFDLHASTASFKKLFQFDNSILDSSLKQLGFTVSSNSTSASNYTLPSMAATFTMNVLPLDRVKQLNFRQMYRARESIRNNPLVPFLQQSGYRVVNASPFPLWQNDTSWLYHNGWGQPESLIHNQTLLPYLLHQFNWFFARYLPALVPWKEELIHRDDVSTISTALQRTQQEIQQQQVTQPRFVYTHLFIPHEPIKFDSSGTQVPWTKTVSSTAVEEQQFLHQLIYCRKLILSLATAIQQQNARPAVIIFQGDHGYRVPLQSAQAGEMVQILNAVYFPDGTDERITNQFYSPNTFRVLVNRYFGGNMPMLPPRHTLIELK